MSNFVNTYIKPYAKAITAFGVSLIVAALAKIGFNADDQTTAVLTAIVTAVLNAFFVWLVPNNPPS